MVMTGTADTIRPASLLAAVENTETTGTTDTTPPASLPEEVQNTAATATAGTARPASLLAEVENIATTGAAATARPTSLLTEVEKVTRNLDDASARGVKKKMQRKRETLKETLYRDVDVSINTTAAIGEEMLVLDPYAHQVVVNTFHADDWEILYTKSNAPIGSDYGGNMCGIWALFGSIHEQAATLHGLGDDHPLKDKMRSLTWEDVHAAVNDRKDDVHDGKGTTCYYSEEQIALGLQEIDQRLKLVVVGENLETNGSMMARRATGSAEWNQMQLLDEGYNLYIYHRAGEPPFEHWQAMRRIDNSA
jgi:hypothetical protein